MIGPHVREGTFFACLVSTFYKSLVHSNVLNIAIELLNVHHFLGLKKRVKGNVE